MKNYSLKQCEELIDKYVNELGGTLSIIEEGVLGLGVIILHGAKGYKNIIIKEYYISAWSSGHSVRQYNKVPKKYHDQL